MTDKRDDDQPDLEREIRQARRFTPEDALARMAGPGALKGASPVSPVQQAETEIGMWLRANLHDPAGALQLQLHRHLKGSEGLLGSLEQPLLALRNYLRRILETEHLLEEVVREADVEWGRRMDERPHFEREGPMPHPDDPYTIEGVRQELSETLKKLPAV
jgi:hypothetical protein